MPLLNRGKVGKVGKVGTVTSSIFVSNSDVVCPNLGSEIYSVEVERQEIKTARDAAGNLLRVYTGASIINYML